MKQKMKWMIVGALLCSSSVAFATKARLSALGQSRDGSQFIDDNRNIFLNPAVVNKYPNLVTAEWGNTASDLDSAATPKAEGGLFMSTGGFVLGVHMGHEFKATQGARVATQTVWDNNGDVGTTDATDPVTVPEQNLTDFFFGMNAGFANVGLGLTYSDNKGESASQKFTDSSMGVRLGLSADMYDVFFNTALAGQVKVSNKDAGTAAGLGEKDLKGKSFMDLGTTVRLGVMDVFAYYAAVSFEESKAKNKFDHTEMKLGFAKAYEAGEKGVVWASLAYESTQTDRSYASGAQKFEATTAALPVGVAMEVKAKDWLSLRGSVKQNLLISEESEKSIPQGGTTTKTSGTIANSTTVAAGMSLVFDTLSIDGVIGNNTEAGAAGNDTAAGNGTLRTDALASSVSMTYTF
jgi:hypothetical protein